jgi:hypothetical protein
MEYCCTVTYNKQVEYQTSKRSGKYMHIDSYQFGKIVIDGVDYSKDCLILDGVVQANWWRKRGHLLSAEDLEPVIKAKPTVLIVGCGKSGLMKIPNETRHVLLEEDIQLEAADTARAVERFNELSQTDVKIAAALHLTC